MGLLLTLIFLLCLREYAGFSLLLAYLLAVNVATFGLYAYDKTIAGFETLRVPERTLHVFQFIGGTPFALRAQQTLRHKTRKSRFRVVFWLLSILQLGLLAAAFWYWRQG